MTSLKPIWTVWPLRIVGLGLIVALLAMVAATAIELSAGDAGLPQSESSKMEASATSLAYTVFVWLIVPGALFIWAIIRGGKEFKQRLAGEGAPNQSDPVRVGIPVPVPSVRSKLRAESAKVIE